MALLGLAHEPVDLRAAVLRVARQPLDLAVAVPDVVREPLDLGVAGLGLADEPFDLGVALLDVAREPLDLRVAVLGVVRQPLDLLALLLVTRPSSASSCCGCSSCSSRWRTRPTRRTACFRRRSRSAGERADLALALGECVLGRREPRPLLLQLREEQRLGASVRLGLVALDGTRIVFGLELRRLHDAERRRAGHSTVVLVAPLDLRAQARTESGLHRELDPVLRRERARKIGAGHEAERDDRLTEPLPRHLLLNEGAFELVVGQKTLFDEQASKGTPRNAGRFHITRYRRRCPRRQAVSDEMPLSG